MLDVYVNGISIDIGRQGENDARNIYFDLSDLISVYGEGTATLVHMRPSDKLPYVCETVRTGDFLIWVPSNIDTAYSGSGKCELRWVVGETLAKSIIYNTAILPSITGAEGVPSPYKSWYDAIIAYIEANYAANGAPQEVREAIYMLLSKAAYTETGLTDELAIVQAWTAETLSVTNNLTHVTNSNTATMAEQGGSYTGTLTADSGYTLGTVSVTMGGEDVTATVYSSGTITIPSVTGDIVITATAVPAVASLSAVYTQSGTVYIDDELDSLKSDLVVTATYGDSSTEVVTTYTLSGTLTAGTSTITVSYGGKTSTFSVTVTAPLYSIADFAAQTISSNGSMTVSKVDGVYHVSGTSPGAFYLSPSGVLSTTRSTAAWFTSPESVPISAQMIDVSWDNPSSKGTQISLKYCRSDTTGNIATAYVEAGSNTSGTNGSASFENEEYPSRPFSGLVFQFAHLSGDTGQYSSAITASFKVRLYFDGVRYL